MRAISAWKQEHNYCISCRNLHSSRSKPGKIDLPLCDKTNGKKCERIRDWQDEETGEIHDTPFHLLPSNYLAMELYGRIISFSPYQHVEYKKNGKEYKGAIPSITATEFVVDTFMPENFSDNDKQLLIIKILLIHRIKLQYILA